MDYYDLLLAYTVITIPEVINDLAGYTLPGRQTGSERFQVFDNIQPLSNEYLATMTPLSWSS
jgi:hypothetical protein